jgi:hypothetical protein
MLVSSSTDSAAVTRAAVYRAEPLVPGAFTMSVRCLFVVACVLSIAGCVDPPPEPGAEPSPGASSSSSTGTGGPIQTRKTINQKTQNVMRMEEAIAAGGVPAEKPENDGGLGVIAGAYRSSVAKLGNIAVQQAMQPFII